MHNHGLLLKTFNKQPLVLRGHFNLFPNVTTEHRSDCICHIAKHGNIEIRLKESINITEAIASFHQLSHFLQSPRLQPFCPWHLELCHVTRQPLLHYPMVPQRVLNCKMSASCEGFQHRTLIARPWQTFGSVGMWFFLWLVRKLKCERINWPW